MIIIKNFYRIKCCPDHEVSLASYFFVFGMIPDNYFLRKFPYSNMVSYRPDRTPPSKLLFAVIRSQNKTLIGLFTTSEKGQKQFTQ